MQGKDEITQQNCVYGFSEKYVTVSGTNSPCVLLRRMNVGEKSPASQGVFKAFCTARAAEAAPRYFSCRAGPSACSSASWSSRGWTMWCGKRRCRLGQGVAHFATFTLWPNNEGVRHELDQSRRSSHICQIGQRSSCRF